MGDLKTSAFSLNQFHIDEFFIKRDPVKEGKPEFDFNPKGLVNNENGTFLLTMDFSVKDSNDAYHINCKCVGYFKFKVEENDELTLSNYFYTNAPAIVFPYIRSYIASVTALSGLPAVHLPLVNFPKSIGELLKENTTVQEKIV